MTTPTKPKTYYQVHMYAARGERAGILSSYFDTAAEARAAAKMHVGRARVVCCKVVRTTVRVVAEVRA